MLHSHREEYAHAILYPQVNSKNNSLSGQQPHRFKFYNAYVYLLALASVCIITGLIWDFAWHKSIGRDTQFSPPHLFLYAGGIIAGFTAGFRVLRISFFGTATERMAAVKFWKVFYSPLGGMFCIWGALSMLTSVPFDDWWHNTYGLDVKVISPPHILLIAGMIAIQMGSCISISAVAARKLPGGDLIKNYNFLFAIAAGSIMATMFFLFYEFFKPSLSHYGNFYINGAIVFTCFLVMAARASNIKWGATAAAGVYIVEYLIMLWVLPLFPAQPLVGPVYHHFDHYQPFAFPLLLVLPAIPVDIIISQWKNLRVWVKVPLASVLFLLVFFIVQWYFGGFYHTSTYTRNWFFASDSLGYYADPDYKYRYAFNPYLVDTGLRLVKKLTIAGGFAIISGTVGYILGTWLKKVKR